MAQKLAASCPLQHKGAAMGDTAKKRLQIGAGAIHADDGKGRALCGTKAKTRWKSLGSGKVTCRLCKRHT
jgi:hypothetical protein